MKLLLLFAGIVLSGLLSAQRPATVECRIGEEIGTKIHLFRVENGKKVSMAEAVYEKNGYYGFKFIPTYEGFYVIGDDKRFQYPVYLKEGDVVSVYMDKDGIRLEGKNTPENETLYRWIALSNNIEAKSVRFYRARSTYKDFFPEFEAFIPAADQFKPTVKTKNARFNELMKRSIDFEKDLYALSFIYTPRSEHPTKEQRPAYYSTIVNSEKFKDDVLLQMPYGMQLLNLYKMFVGLSAKAKDGLEAVLPLIQDKRLKGEMIVERGGGFKSYFEYKEFADRYISVLSDEQKQRLEEFGSKLYEMRKGQPAVDFTYPDAEGRMVSLSDFKGKVVLVDVWATWCGPCRGEIPHLKKLEEEMKGTDVVFIGVSLDEEKNYEKWKKFLKDESLGGVQLFGKGFSKIAKDYKITGIPRFMVFGRDGNIVEATSPRPSDPALKKLLEEELKK